MSSRLAALPGRELRPLADQLEQLQQQVGALPAVDLAPITEQLDTLRAESPRSVRPTSRRCSRRSTRCRRRPRPAARRLATIERSWQRSTTATSSASSTRSRSSATRSPSLPTTDLDPLVARLDALREQLAAAARASTSTRSRQRIDALAAQVAAIPPPDLEPAPAPPRRPRRGRSRAARRRGRRAPRPHRRHPAARRLGDRGADRGACRPSTWRRCSIARRPAHSSRHPDVDLQPIVERIDASPRVDLQPVGASPPCDSLDALIRRSTCSQWSTRSTPSRRSTCDPRPDRARPRPHRPRLERPRPVTDLQPHAPIGSTPSPPSTCSRWSTGSTPSRPSTCDRCADELAALRARLDGPPRHRPAARRRPDRRHPSGRPRASSARCEIAERPPRRSGERCPSPTSGRWSSGSTALQRALTDGLASLPAPPDDAEVREDVARLNAQLDALRTALADRFDAIPAPDLAPVTTELAALAERIGAIPAPDLDPLEARLARLDQQVAACPTPPRSPPRSPRRSTPSGRPTAPTRCCARSDRGRRPALREQVAGLPDPAAATEASVAPLRADLEALAAPAPSCVERPGPRHRGARRSHAAGPGRRPAAHRSSPTRSRSPPPSSGRRWPRRSTELGRALGGQVQQVESQVVQLVARSAPSTTCSRAWAASARRSHALTAARRPRRRGQPADRRRAGAGAGEGDGVRRRPDDGGRRRSAGAIDEQRGGEPRRHDRRRSTSALATRLAESIAAAWRRRSPTTSTAGLAELGITQLRRSVAEVAAAGGGGPRRRSDRAAVDRRARRRPIGAAPGGSRRAARRRDRPRRPADRAPSPHPTSGPWPPSSPGSAPRSRPRLATRRPAPTTSPPLRAALEEALAALGVSASIRHDRDRRGGDGLGRVVAEQARPRTSSPTSVEERAPDPRRSMQSPRSSSYGLEVREASQGLRTPTPARSLASRGRREEQAHRPTPPARRPRRSTPASTMPCARSTSAWHSLAQLVERAGAFADDAAQAAVATLRVVSAPPPPGARTVADPPRPPRPAPPTPADGRASDPLPRRPPAKKTAAKKTPAKKAAAAQQVHRQGARPRQEGAGQATPPGQAGRRQAPPAEADRSSGPRSGFGVEQGVELAVEGGVGGRAGRLLAPRRGRRAAGRST